MSFELGGHIVQDVEPRLQILHNSYLTEVQDKEHGSLNAQTERIAAWSESAIRRLNGRLPKMRMY